MESKNVKETDVCLIPNDWQSATLGKLISHKKGFAFKSQWFKDSGYPVVKVKDLTSDSIDMNDCVFLDIEKSKEFEDVKLEENDILITTVGSWPTNPDSVVGKVIKVPKKSSGAYLNQNAVRIRAKDTLILNQIYIFYRLKNKDFSNYLISGAQGSANQASITLNDIFRFEFFLPTLKEQENIGNFFYLLDKKIELNLKMNQNLEEVSKAIFKHWFIHFEFLNDEGKHYKASGGEMVDSELGEIPKGWEVEKLGNYVNTIKGCSYKSADLNESKNALVTLKSIGRDGKFKKNGFKEYSGDFKEDQVIIDGDVVIAQTDLTQKADVLGKPVIVRSVPNYKNLIASLDLAIIRPKNEYLNREFIYEILKTKTFHSHAISYANGTTVLHLSKDAVPEFKIAIPPKSLIDNFSSIILPIFEKMNINNLESENLVNIRDLILPKLMSGKIRVNILEEASQ